jgi:hypothetical protein
MYVYNTQQHNKIRKKTKLISQQATLKNSMTWEEGDLYACVLKDGETPVEKKSEMSD